MAARQVQPRAQGGSEGQRLGWNLRLSVHPSIYPSIRLSIHPSIYPSIRLSVHPSVRTSLLAAVPGSLSPRSSIIYFPAPSPASCSRAQVRETTVLTTKKPKKKKREKTQRE